MNRELFVAAIEQRLSSRLRLALALFVSVFGGFAFSDMFPVGYMAPILLAYIVTAGILGKEFSSGTPQLTFARPITRASYVLSRWLACAALTVGLSLLMLGIGLAFAYASHGPLPNVGRLGAAVLSGVGASAVLVGFSALSNGYADVVLVAATGVFTGLLGQSAALIHDPDTGYAVSRTADILYALAFPALTRGADVAAAITLASLLAFAATALGWLVVAIALVSRREITYATD